MNQHYRLVWSQVNQAWVAVAENAKGYGKSIAARKLVAAAAALMGGSLLASSAYAADAANAKVVGGTGSVSQSGATTTINQSTQRLAIDWTGLSTAANEALVFKQPNAAAIALNRITGSSPSTLLGSLTANGQVYILNPNGVLFGAGAQVNVGGLVASTLAMNPNDFMNGSSTFTKDPNASGSVVNQGTLTAADGGYIALLSGTVRNTGTINAPLGTGLLAAGDKVTLNINNGSLIGYSIDQGDLNALVENKQLIRTDGGSVIVVAKALDKLSTAVINNTGVVEARTVRNQNGHILLLGDLDVGTVNVGGTLDASAPSSGNGGTIETSAAHVKIADGTVVTTTAAQGLTGSWLIDPTDFTISSGSGAQTTSGIGAATLSSNLANTSVTLTTDSSTGADIGDINVNAAVSWSANTTLTLNAYNNINVNAAITVTGASAGLVLNYGDYGTTGIVPSNNIYPNYNVKAPITLSGASASLSIDGATYKLLHSMADLTALAGTNLNGHYALAGDLDAGGTTYTSALIGGSNGPFTGTFAGFGHTISNLTINASGGNTQYVGLFGYANSPSVIRDIGLVGGSVSGHVDVGGLVGVNTGRIINAYTTGNVAGTPGSVNVGGLVGLNHFAGNITSSYTTGNVSGDLYVGGLVGGNDFGDIYNAYATGSVSGYSNVGGLAGMNSRTAVTNAYATGSVSGTSYVGGLVGYNDRTSSITNSYWDSGSTGQSTAVGVNAGTLTNVSAVTSSNAYSHSSYSNLAMWGWSETASGSGVWLAVGCCGNDWVLIEGSTRPFLYSEYSTSIRNAHQLQLMAVDTSAGYTLIGNVDAGETSGSNASGMWSTAGFAPIGINGSPFSGTFNGLNHTVSNLTINRPSANYAGLFGLTGSGSAIENVGLVGASVTGADYVGGVVGGNNGTLSTSYATGSVTGLNNVGGLAGSNDGTVGNSYASGSVDGTDYVGGLIGNNSTGTVGSSYATGSVTGLGYAGGLVGANSNTITASFWNTASSGLSIGVGSGSSSGVTGIDNTAASDLATFTNAGWSIGATGGTSTLWRIYDGETGPLLRSFLTGITVTADATSKTYDGTTSTASTYSTSINGAALSGSLNYVTSKNAGTYSTASSTLTQTGLYSGQQGYDISYANASLTINKANLTLSTSDVTKTYDGTTTASGTAVATVGTIFTGDSLSGGTFVYADKNAGTGDKTVTTSGVTVGDGTNNSNYNITYVANTTSTINQAHVTLSTSDLTKTYDGTTAASGTAVATVGTIFTGDSLSGGTFAYTDKNAGSNKTVTANGVTISDGNGGNNYNVTYADNTSSTINKANLIATATGVNKIYDGLSNATVTYTDNRIAGDTLNFSSTASFADKNVGNGKAIIVNSIVLNGADAGNYNLTTTGSTSANITPAALTVTANSSSKFYDGIAYAGNNGSTISGLVNGETLADLFGALAYSGSSRGAIGIGSYAITPGGLRSANYTIGFVDGVLTIKALSQASAALGGSTLEQAYNGARQTVIDISNSDDQNTQSSVQKTSAQSDKNGNTIAKSRLIAGNSNSSNGSTGNITPRLSIVGCGVNMPIGSHCQ